MHVWAGQVTITLLICKEYFMSRKWLFVKIFESRLSAGKSRLIRHWGCRDERCRWKHTRTNTCMLVCIYIRYMSYFVIVTNNVSEIDMVSTITIIPCFHIYIMKRSSSEIDFLVWFDFCFTAFRHIFRSFRARSVNLTTLFLGKPPRQFTST